MAELTIRISDKVLRIGLILLGAIALSWTVWYLISTGTFVPKYRLTMFVSEADGLIAGAPVLLDDVRVGTVREVQLARTSASAERRNELVLQIEKRYASEIRSDAVGFLATVGFLGERYVGIRRGFNGIPLKPGDEISFTPPPPGALDRIADAIKALPVDKPSRPSDPR
jgi:ABC-type transporter Mla subunit MlaD